MIEGNLVDCKARPEAVSQAGSFKFMAALARLALLKSQSQAVRQRLFSEHCNTFYFHIFNSLFIYFNNTFFGLCFHITHWQSVADHRCLFGLFGGGCVLRDRDCRIERNYTVIYSGIFVDILFMDQLTLAWVDFPLHYFNLWVDPKMEGTCDSARFRRNTCISRSI